MTVTNYYRRGRRSLAKTEIRVTLLGKGFLSFVLELGKLRFELEGIEARGDHYMGSEGGQDSVADGGSQGRGQAETMVVVLLLVNVEHAIFQNDILIGSLS